MLWIISYNEYIVATAHPNHDETLPVDAKESARDESTQFKQTTDNFIQQILIQDCFMK